VPLEWEPLLQNMSEAQRLIHERARLDSVDVQRMSAELLALRRQAFNDELLLQAEALGYPDQRGNLTDEYLLAELEAQSEEDAKSIANTFNYFLAVGLLALLFPTVKDYERWFLQWSAEYWAQKDPVIVQIAAGTAAALAQQAFYQRNRVGGSAKLQPRTAVCPVCLGWIARGLVPLFVALNNPPPYHPRCPHYWEIRPERAAAPSLADLWMGE